VIGGIARNRGAERGADADRAAGYAQSKVEAAAAAREIGNDQRQNHSHDGGADSVERLHNYDGVGIAHQRKNDPARCERRKAET